MERRNWIESYEKKIENKVNIRAILLGHLLGKGTAQAVFIVRELQEKCRDKRKLFWGLLIWRKFWAGFHIKGWHG